MTIKEMYDTLVEYFEAGGDGNLPVEVFEVRSSCTMPVQEFLIENDGGSILVDQADS